jgi:hypothetical protein
VTAPPTAAEIVADVARAADLDPSAAPAILAQLGAASLAVAARLAAAPPQPPAQTSEDRLVDAEHAAAMLCMSEKWCRTSGAARPLRVMVGTDVRFSVQRIQRFIRLHAGQ